MILEILHEQLLEYSDKLIIVEAEMIRKYRAGEDYSEEGSRALYLKALKEECVRMMDQHQNKK